MTATIATVAACSPQKPGTVAKDGSVTVKHMFGETRVPAAPNETIGDRNVFTGKDLAGAIAFASPLSYPVVADRLPPALTKALG